MYLLILGANSDVAQAVARKFAKAEKANLYLASRDMEILQKRAQDIVVRHEVQAVPLYFDATDYASHAGFYAALDPKPDGVVLAFGYLGDQEQAQQNFQEARNIVETNYLGAVSVLEIIAADFERRGHGFIIGLSSVAGERGRRRNYMYGAAKGALTVYLSGLRNRLAKRGVRVITILPGFIQTKMTANMKIPQFLLGNTTEVSEDIYRAFKKSQNIIYTKWFWKWIMQIIRMIPESLFKRLDI